jgi:hypothetical protein
VRKLLGFLLFASVALAQKSATPFKNPNYDADDPRNNQKVEVTVTVPKDGIVRVPFMEPFGREPSCHFQGGTLPGKRPEVTKFYAMIKAKPKAKMTVTCEGVKRAE